MRTTKDFGIESGFARPCDVCGVAVMERLNVPSGGGRWTDFANTRRAAIRCNGLVRCCRVGRYAMEFDMSEPATASDLAVKACYHIVRRYQTDPNFRHYMHFTESMYLVMQAVAADKDMDVEELRNKLDENAAKSGTAEIVQLREAVESVSQLASDAKYVGDENVPVSRIMDSIDAAGVCV